MRFSSTYSVIGAVMIGVYGSDLVGNADIPEGSFDYQLLNVMLREFINPLFHIAAAIGLLRLMFMKNLSNYRVYWAMPVLAFSVYMSLNHAYSNGGFRDAFLVGFALFLFLVEEIWSRFYTDGE